MTLFKHTEPPKRAGYYLVGNNLGHLWQAWFNPHNEEFDKWTKLNGNKEDAPIDFWFDEQPPKEIEDVLDKIEKQLSEASPIPKVVITYEEAEQLLKLQAE